MGARKIADEKDVLRFYTGLLRQEEDAKLADAIKAAEFFVKYYGMLEKNIGDSSKTVVIVDDISKVKKDD